jgi:hypothetical protein
MGEIIKQTTSGTYTPTVTSLQGNTVTAGKFWYIRIGNIVQIGGTISALTDIMSDDEIFFNVPFVNLFSDTAQATGTYSVQRPSNSYASPDSLNLIAIYSQILTNTVTIAYQSSSPTTGIGFVFYINVFYTIQ